MNIGANFLTGDEAMFVEGFGFTAQLRTNYRYVVI